MTFTQLPRWSPKPTWPDKSTLPTMYDLPSEDPEEPGLPDEFHDYQPELLSATFKLQSYADDNLLTAADLNLYYDPEHLNWYKRPDWFAAVGVSRAYEGKDMRLSYVIWQEEVSPFVVVELISPGTENEDFGRTRQIAGRPPTKWTVYEEILQIPYYVIYDRYTDSLSGFRLVEGRYRPIEIGKEIGAERKIWMPEINAGLGLWHGKYKRFTRTWLRCYTREGWVPTDLEAERLAKEQAQQAALQAQQAALQAQQAALQAQQKNAQLAAKLQALGIDIDDL
jgi:Uma2 family endonuclease